MNKNNITNIHLRWLLFVLMLTLFTMLDHSTATSSENEEEKGNYLIGIQNVHQVQESSPNAVFVTKVDPNTRMNQAIDLLLRRTEIFYQSTKNDSDKVTENMISTQNALADIQKRVTEDKTSTILDKMSILETISNKRSELIELEMVEINQLMTAHLKEESSIWECSLQKIRQELTAYKDSHEERMQIQVAEWEQQLEQQEQKLNFDEGKARRTHAFSIAQKKEEQAIRERDIEIEYQEQVYKLKLQQLEQAQAASSR